MNNIKVKGILDEKGIKNYMITNTDSGEVHAAVREGQFSFRVGEFVGTLGQCKRMVSAGHVVHFADAKPGADGEAGGTWGCVDPCALLILLADKTDPEVRRTLDAYGWVTQDGELDIEQANESYGKWSQK